MSHGSHSNYLNVHSSHANTGHVNSGGHSNSGGHTNTGTHANTGAHSNHSNHASTSDPNTGLPITLTWTNWAANPSSGELVSNSSQKIKELREL